MFLKMGKYEEQATCQLLEQAQSDCCELKASRISCPSNIYESFQSQISRLGPQQSLSSKVELDIKYNQGI